MAVRAKQSRSKDIPIIECRDKFYRELQALDKSHRAVQTLGEAMD